MTLAAGDRLGRYEVVAPLGKGGMGEVYRARDSTLEREVAVKVLPEAVAGDPDRLARFEREAKAVARLAHPNILEIWDFGSDRGVAFAVTELLEGGTLRDELATGPLHWRKAREIAATVADGLAAAHGKGIVHRDLKPENIFVTADGRIKILDFGLARFEGPISSEAATGTLTPADTQRGVVLGTLGYISPEQLKGEPADARSDIFSLGCVLYEMLTGERAFLRDSAVETMAAILKEDPPRFAATGVAVSPELARTVERCLEKRPERRFQSAADLAFALRAIVSDSDVPRSGSQAQPVTPLHRRGRSGLWLTAAVVAVLAIVAAVAWRVVPFQRNAPHVEPVEASVESTPIIKEWVFAVAPFENRTGEPSLDALGKELADAVAGSIGLVTQGFSTLPRLTVLGVSSVKEGSTTEPLPPAQGRVLLTGSFASSGSGLAVTAQVRDQDGLRVLFTSDRVVVGRSLPDGDLEPLLSRLEGAAGMQLLMGLQNVSHVPTGENFRRFIRCRDHFMTVPPRQARCDDLAAVIEDDPEFLEAVLFAGFGLTFRDMTEQAKRMAEHVEKRASRLTPFESAYLELLTAWNDGELSRALGAARTLQQLAPRYFPARVYRCVLAMQLNRPAEMVAVAEATIQAVPPELRATRRGGESLLLDAYRALGQFDELLELARRVRRERPGDTVAFMHEARALAALGRLDELAAVVDECRTTPGGECDPTRVEVEASWYLRAYGHKRQALEYGARAVADFQAMGEADPRFFPIYYLYALRAAERWQDYGAYAARCVQERPDDPELEYFRCCSGIAAAHLGNREEAAATLARLEADGVPMLAAYVAAHLGERDRALALVREGITQTSGTYRDVRQWDLDLEPLWGYPPFEELIRPKG